MNMNRIERLLEAKVNLTGEEVPWEVQARKCMERFADFREKERDFIGIMVSRSYRKEPYQPSLDQLKWIRFLYGRMQIQATKNNQIEKIS